MRTATEVSQHLNEVVNPWAAIGQSEVGLSIIQGLERARAAAQSNAHDMRNLYTSGTIPEWQFAVMETNQAVVLDELEDLLCILHEGRNCEH